MKTDRYFSDAIWEKKVGYCRAVRKGNFISVSGTAPVGETGETSFPGDAYEQTKRCLEILGEALHALGADFSCVIRTRLFVTDISRWQAFGKAHAEVFGAFPPATSMVEVSRLIDSQMLIEVEADAIVADSNLASLSR